MCELSIDLTQLQASLSSARQTLLDQRHPNGHWEGELSSSALSTAIAVAALAAFEKHASQPTDFSQLIEKGLQWLVETQNEDGGWGDTTKSFSNISTTAICWAAFGICGADERFSSSMKATKGWLTKAAGSLDPAILSKRIADRYGKDRTFSVPILTTLAIAGRLGDENVAWKYVPQLPFELAAFPHTWFHRLQLPVVSYALPALIAIGQVRHHRRPSFNPITRTIRNAVRGRTLRVLQSVQPESGGFLEATPLTSFVVLSLALAGNADFGVAQRGIQFLVESVRDDGSWPIDTNLATWVTTLSINALHCGGNESPAPRLNTESQQTILDWLLRQQYRAEHPYTHSPPGGWAWTDLTGGVPDADDTPGALLALTYLQPTADEARWQDCVEAAAAGVNWLLNLQNRDGGIPTFCKGWGKLPFDRSSADLTAHTIRAWIAWRNELPQSMQQRVDMALERAFAFLATQQRDDGSWVPLWFGCQFHDTEENPTYGTTRVLIALQAAFGKVAIPSSIRVDAAVEWLIKSQNEDGGWGGHQDTPSTIEETSYAVDALASLFPTAQDGSTFCAVEANRIGDAISQGVHWLGENTQQGTSFPPSPIGFYFAKLWYFEALYPVVNAVSALSRVAQLHERRVADQDSATADELGVQSGGER